MPIPGKLTPFIKSEVCPVNSSDSKVYFRILEFSVFNTGIVTSGIIVIIPIDPALMTIHDLYPSESL